MKHGWYVMSKCLIPGYHHSIIKFFVWDGGNHFHDAEPRCIRHEPSEYDMEEFQIREITQEEYEAWKILQG